MSSGAWSTLSSRGFGSESSVMANRVDESSASVNGGGGKDSGSFECNICLELAQDPVVTLCGHLFCWPCLYEWLHVHAHTPECPVCKAVVVEEKLVPLYGRGKTSTEPRSRSVAGVQIPSRPAGQRPATAPQPDHHNHYQHPNPWFVGGGPVAGGRWGNYTFSAAIGGLFPLLNFHVHGFPQATAYGPAAGFPYGYDHSFHGWHGYGFPRQAVQGQQVDIYLKDHDQTFVHGGMELHKPNSKVVFSAPTQGRASTSGGCCGECSVGTFGMELLLQVTSLWGADLIARSACSAPAAAALAFSSRVAADFASLRVFFHCFIILSYCFFCLLSILVW